jgi:NodT family efflux transporter outer membrane factor (OMF) lipoprotein
MTYSLEMPKLKALVATALPIFLLSSCAMVGPDYKRPAVDVAAEWNTDNHGVKAKPVHSAAWWESFNDPVLTSLIEEGYTNSLTLQSTAVKVLQSRAQLAQSVGELYPQQQSISGSYTHEQIGQGNQLSGVIPSEFDLASATLAADWEVDFWGKYRRAIQANDASFLSSIAAYDDALISLTADIASSYVSIRTYQTQIFVTEENIKLQKEGLRIAQIRFNSGQVSLLDVEQALTELNNTESTLPSLRTDLQKEKDTLAVLLGTTPNKVDALVDQKRARIPVVPSSIAVGIPKDILRQRPDVREAELNAIAQSESIGAIKAQLYPALSLSGSFGYSSNDIGNNSVNDLFKWSNHTIAIGPSVSLPLFNYGQITNQVRAQDAIFQQAILNYQNTVLNAQKEVQDGIVSYVESQKTTKSLIRANAAAVKTTELALIRYKSGETDYTTVLDAEKDQLSVQTSLTNAQGSIPQGLISLYRALGGGWQIRQGHDVVPASIKQEMGERTDWGNLLNQDNHEAPTTKEEKIEQTYLPSW